MLTAEQKDKITELYTAAEDDSVEEPAAPVEGEHMQKHDPKQEQILMYITLLIPLLLSRPERLEPSPQPRASRPKSSPRHLAM